MRKVEGLLEPELAEDTQTVPIEGFLRDTFRELNASGLRYAVPRNWQALPFDAGKDLDILLPADDLTIAAGLIRAVAARAGLGALVRRDDGQGLGIDVVHLHGDAATLAVCFDLRAYLSFSVFRTTTRGTNYKVFAEQLQSRPVVTNDCEIQVLTPIDEFICLFFQYQSKRLQNIAHKVREYSEKLEQLLGDSHVAAWLRDMNTGMTVDDIRARAFAPNDWQPFGLMLLHKRWGRLTPLRLVAAQFRASLIRLRFLRPHLAPMIYFSGPDGAGKTTLTDGVKDRLRSCESKFMYVYSLKLVLRGITKRLAFIKRIGRGSAARREYLAEEGVPDLLFLTEDTRDRDTGSAFWRLRKRLALLVGIADIWLGWLIALPMRLRGQYVLVETSPYDLFIKYHMPEFPYIETILGPLIPRPSVGFLLRADPAKIVARKAELTIEEIEDYYTRFDRVLDRCRARRSYRILGTDSGPQATAANAFRVVTSLSA
jgi:hypothetical protein